MKKFIKKNILIGGDDSFNIKQLQKFFALIIIGYFGIKIIYAWFFKFYPQKYYYKNIKITSNEEENNITKDIVINSFMPGLWNNEMSDFITLIVIAFIIYIFTNVSSKSIINQYGNFNMSFLFGYIVGLGYPAIFVNYKSFFDKNSTLSKYFSLTFLVAIIINIIHLNFKSASQVGITHSINYIIYIVVFILLIFGILGTRKLSKNYSTVTYFNNDTEKCAFSKNGVIQSSGDNINITLPFLAFLIILLFSYEPSEMSVQNYYIFVYGLLLGIIVSGVSYFGIEYILNKVPEKECNSINECLIQEMPTPNINVNLSNIYSELNNSEDNITDENTDNNNYIQNINTNINTNLIKNEPIYRKISPLNLILIIFIVILSIYLVYYYMTNII
jgi:hypothetical protein